MSANKTGAGFMILAMGAFALEDSFFKAVSDTLTVELKLVLGKVNMFDTHISPVSAQK